MTNEVKSLEELRAVAEGFLHEVAQIPSEKRATVVGLSGDLGAGKTAFVKCIADVLGIKETITSPTFILEKVYTIPRGSLLGACFTKLIHIDAYRLHSGSEMRALDWDTITRDPANLIFIEWPEQVTEVMPKETISLSFEYVNESTRKITF
mgnify:CR=1 FL=1